MDYQTVSYLKKNAANLNLDEPMTITQNGKPVYVVVSHEDYEKKEDAIALMKFVSFGKSDVKEGLVMSMKEIKSTLGVE